MKSQYDPQAMLRRAIKFRRRALGMTQDEAGAALGVSRLTYHRMEAGVRRLKFEEIGTICEVFSCTAHDLDPALGKSIETVSKHLLGAGNEQ